MTLEHQDGDHDGEDPVGERQHPIGVEPALLPPSKSQTVLLDRESTLDLHERPDAVPDVLFNFPPVATGLGPAGSDNVGDGVRWSPIHSPSGVGWALNRNLVDERALDAFMQDQAPAELVADFVHALEHGSRKLDRIVSARGLTLAVGGRVRTVPFEQVRQLIGNGLEGNANRVQLQFRETIALPFITACRATPELSPKTPHSSKALLPVERQTFHYLTLRRDLVGQPWLVFFEYVGDRPCIVGFGIDA